jgi:RimJ/RimL family protein N-acetyltransferase
MDLLSSGRVRLRTLLASDLEDHIRWRHDPEVAYWATAGSIAWHLNSVARIEHHFSKALVELDPRADGILAIELDGARNIGMVDYRDVDDISRSATIGITIGEKSEWGQGHGSTAVRLLVGYLFGPRNLRRVQLDTWSGNPRAIRAFEKVGFREEGRRREAVRAPDGYYDEVIMGLLRSEWDGAEPASGPAAP